MATLEEVEAQRNAVLEELRSIRSMARGTINEQFLKVRHRGFKEAVSVGPYYVLSRYEPEVGKTKSRRLTSKEEVEQARKDVAAYQRFVSLCREFEALTQRLGELERGTPEQEAKKKLRRSPSSKKAR
jgi:hypothetical protein